MFRGDHKKAAVAAIANILEPKIRISNSTRLAIFTGVSINRLCVCDLHQYLSFWGCFTRKKIGFLVVFNHFGTSWNLPLPNWIGEALEISTSKWKHLLAIRMIFGAIGSGFVLRSNVATQHRGNEFVDIFWAACEQSSTNVIFSLFQFWFLLLPKKKQYRKISNLIAAIIYSFIPEFI